MKQVIFCFFYFAALRSLSRGCQLTARDSDILNLLDHLALDASDTVASADTTRESLTGVQETPRHLQDAITTVRGGGWLVPAGYNPFGYKITSLGEEFLSYEGSLDSDVGRFLASLKSERKRFGTLKGQWLEVLRVSKSGQSMRIYKNLQELLALCLKMGLID
jgi:hypothetical protein